MISEYKTREQVLQAFREFFEWTYEVQFSPSHAATIDEQILSGWSNTDESDLRLVKFVVHLHSLVAGAGSGDMSSLRKQAQANMRVEFSRPASNDASRIIAQVHRAVEELRPKVTGVPVIARTAATKPVPEVVPVATAGQPAPAPSSSAPIDLAGLKALIQQVNASTQALQVASQASMPMQQYVAQPLAPQVGPQPVAPAQAINQLNQALIQAAAPPPPPDPNDPRQILARQQQVQHDAMMVQMESAISAAKHKSAMAVIGNIG